MALTPNFYHSYATERKEYIQIHRRESGLRVIYTSGYSPEISETALFFERAPIFCKSPTSRINWRRPCGIVWTLSRWRRAPFELSARRLRHC